MRHALVATLEGVGYDVSSATNGEDALLRLLGHEEFDVVMTDFRMPRLGGLELTSMIRREFGDRIRTVGISASDDCCDEFLEAGADAFLEKPVEECHVLDLMERFSEELTCPTSTAL